MILTKSEYETLNSFQELEEKLILFNGGKNYGQIVFMAGGAGSGKGFAIQNFMNQQIDDLVVRVPARAEGFP